VSNLSDFTPLTAGLLVAADVLTWQKALAEWTVDATGTASASMPTMNMRNAKTGTGNGGLLRWFAMNSTPVMTLAATVKGSFLVNTAGAETGNLDFLVPKAGVSKTISLNGNTAAFECAANGEFALGSNTARWSSVLVGNTAGTIKGDLSVDGTGAIVQAATAHPLQLKSNGVTGLLVGTAGNVTFPAGKAVLLGDANNATHSSRNVVTDATAAKSTFLGVAPTTGATQAGVIAYGAATPAASSYIQLTHDNTNALIQSLATGAGTITPLQMKVGATAAAVSLEINGDVRIGSTTALTTTSTAGFFYAPAVDGVMTGVPTARANFCPVMVDITNNKIGIYNGGAWKWTAALT
jgi:hypothetical protein